MLSLAREALGHYLKTGRSPEPPEPSAESGSAGGVFVSLRCRGALRGCIGVMDTGEPLEHDVVHCAISAGTQDPRFAAVTAADLAELTLEISILSTLLPVTEAEEIQVGRDGLQIEQEGRRGLLLPQVATEHGWDRPRFLQELCKKAGLPPDAWKAGAALHRFTAQVFQESPHGD